MNIQSSESSAKDFPVEDSLDAWEFICGLAKHNQQAVLSYLTYCEWQLEDFQESTSQRTAFIRLRKGELVVTNFGMSDSECITGAIQKIRIVQKAYELGKTDGRHGEEYQPKLDTGYYKIGYEDGKKNALEEESDYAY